MTYPASVVLRALGLLDEGMSSHEVSAELGVSSSRVRHWSRQRLSDPSLSWLESSARKDCLPVPGARHGTKRGYDCDGCRCRQCRASAASDQRDVYRRQVLGLPMLVPAIGSKRRIRALMALGWSADLIALHGELEVGQVWRVGVKPTMRRDTAEAISRVYDKLSMTHGPNRYVEGMARSRGYAPPLAWDDDTIDDPTAKPNTGHANGHGKGSGRRGFVSRLPDPDILAAEVNRSGRRVVAERYGSTPDAVWMRLNRAGYRASHTGDIHELPIYRKAAA